MAILPAMKAIRAQDLAGDPESAIATLADAFAQFQREAIDYLATLPAPVSAVAKPFTTDALGTAIVKLANLLGTKATHLDVTQVRRKDGLNTGELYSVYWDNQRNFIQVTLVGLAPSTDYTLSVAYR